MKLSKKWVATMTGNVVPTVVFGALLVTALIYLDELRAWFSLAPADTAAATAPAPVGSAAKAPSFVFPEASYSALRGGLTNYEGVRAKLAADTLEGIDADARAVAEWIRKASAALEEPPQNIAHTMLDAGAAADRLAAATDLPGARRAFGELSESLISLATSDPRLQGGQHIYECPMKEGFNKWLQPDGELANPYMGKEMLQCGGDSTFTGSAPRAVLSHDGHDHTGSDVAFHTCPMHPSVKEAEPGQCPICAMDLTPVTFDEFEGGVVLVDSVRRQRIGVRIGEASVVHMTKTLRTVGKLTYDETQLHDITLKYRGWVEKLYANKLGQKVKRGAPLFAVYSPEIYAAQGDLITALEGPSLFEGVDKKDDPLVNMARERLHLLDAYGVERYVKRTGKPVRYITIASPTTGYVVEKNVVDGSAFAAGARVMRIAGLDKVWVEVDLYESQLAMVKIGQVAEVRLTHQTGKPYRGKLTYIYPYLDPKTRTGKARIELKNDKLELKPDMYANVKIEIDLGNKLTVPEPAVIYTGRRRLVFVDIGEGRLRPTQVKLGTLADGRYEVLSGLNDGDKVVTSGNFLVAAESRIRSAATYWGGADETSPPPVPEPTKTQVNPSPAPVKSPRKPKPAAVIYTCPMHPHIERSEPGTCPICQMQLVPKGK